MPAAKLIAIRSSATDLILEVSRIVVRNFQLKVGGHQPVARH
jgi:hypothetical protein